MFKLRIFQGIQIKPHIETIAQMRIKYFREFPYMYEGSMDYERTYLDGFSKEKDSLLVMAYDGDNLCGFVTGMPLETEASILESLDTATDLETNYYLSEFIVEELYRGKGLSRLLDEAIENKALSLGYSGFSILTVKRADIDPRRPEMYRGTDAVWEKLGFIKTETSILFSWPTILENGSVEDIENLMDFWLKRE